MSRAKIKTPSVVCTPGGARPPMYNPNFEVEHQMEPTDAFPVSQHKVMAGWNGAHPGSAHGPHFKGKK